MSLQTCLMFGSDFNQDELTELVADQKLARNQQDNSRDQCQILKCGLMPLSIQGLLVSL